jgi:hypothetical protein
MRSSRVVRASDSQCRKSQLSWVQSQHPPTQLNLMGGRWSSVEESTEKLLKNSPLQFFRSRSGSCLTSVEASRSTYPEYPAYWSFAHKQITFKNPNPTYFLWWVSRLGQCFTYPARCSTQGWAKLVLIALERNSVALKRLTFNLR